ncbi:uncharacterized protein IL334_003574 [Kwoniella shivajii]|uniref:Glutathione S-transferase n=1 Tax=Kwoniella shivajii TaxID=564305 RepID=A0ABZ1CY87_9TREE|nr:hypothetical protein IL334_003574 [Kwoniella shivajii]
MSFIGLNLTNNYSLYAVPAAWIIAFAPHFYAVTVFNSERAPGTPEWDNREPHSNLAKLKEAKLSPNAHGIYTRAEAAQQNGFQNLPLFAAAVLAGNFARLSPSTLNTTAALYLVSRIIYNVVYITNTTKSTANVRSVVFVSGVITLMSLFVKAGNKLF